MNEPGQVQCFCCQARGREGIEIAGRFLCLDCERLLVQSRPGTEDYDRLIECCKSIWAGLAR